MLWKAAAKGSRTQLCSSGHWQYFVREQTHPHFTFTLLVFVFVFLHWKCFPIEARYIVINNSTSAEVWNGLCDPQDRLTCTNASPCRLEALHFWVWSSTSSCELYFLPGDYGSSPITLLPSFNSSGSIIISSNGLLANNLPLKIGSPSHSNFNLSFHGFSSCCGNSHTIHTLGNVLISFCFLLDGSHLNFTSVGNLTLFNSVVDSHNLPCLAVSAFDLSSHSILLDGSVLASRHSAIVATGSPLIPITIRESSFSGPTLISSPLLSTLFLSDTILVGLHNSLISPTCNLLNLTILRTTIQGASHGLAQICSSQERPIDHLEIHELTSSYFSLGNIQINSGSITNSKFGHSQAEVEILAGPLRITNNSFRRSSITSPPSLTLKSRPGSQFNPITYPLPATEPSTPPDAVPVPFGGPSQRSATFASSEPWQQESSPNIYISDNIFSIAPSTSKLASTTPSSSTNVSSPPSIEIFGYPMPDLAFDGFDDQLIHFGNQTIPGLGITCLNFTGSLTVTSLITSVSDSAASLSLANSSSSLTVHSINTRNTFFLISAGRFTYRVTNPVNGIVSTSENRTSYWRITEDVYVDWNTTLLSGPPKFGTEYPITKNLLSDYHGSLVPGEDWDIWVSHKSTGSITLWFLASPPQSAPTRSVPIPQILSNSAPSDISCIWLNATLLFLLVFFP